MISRILICNMTTILPILSPQSMRQTLSILVQKALSNYRISVPHYVLSESEVDIRTLISVINIRSLRHYWKINYKQVHLYRFVQVPTVRNDKYIQC